MKKRGKKIKRLENSQSRRPCPAPPLGDFGVRSTFPVCGGVSGGRQCQQESPWEAAARVPSAEGGMNVFPHRCAGGGPLGGASVSRICSEVRHRMTELGPSGVPGGNLPTDPVRTSGWETARTLSQSQHIRAWGRPMSPGGTEWAGGRGPGERGQVISGPATPGQSATPSDRCEKQDTPLRPPVYNAVWDPPAGTGLWGGGGWHPFLARMAP